MAQRGTKRWTDLLEEVTEDLNNTRIARKGFAPNEVNARNERDIYERFYMQPRPFKNPAFAVGQKVRKSESILQFRRSFYPGWSPQIFTIAAVNRKYPNAYKLKDYYGKAVAGTFYQQELQKAKHPNYFLIEKILVRRGNRVKVKWLGYEKEGWLNRRDVFDVMVRD